MDVSRQIMTVEEKSLKASFYVEYLIKLVEYNGRDGLKAAFELEGFDVNMSDSSGKTALHHAAISDKMEMIEILLSHPKINVNAVDKLSMTPLTYAAKYGKSRSFTVLLEKGADRSCVDIYGYTAFTYDSVYNKMSCIDALLRNKNYTLEQEVKELMQESEIIGIVKRLIVETTDLFYIKTFGIAVLYYGCHVGSLDTVKLVIEKDIVDINVLKYYVRTPLQAALCGPFLEIADYLIEKGASLAIEDCWGQSTYDYAAKYDNSEKFLENYEPEGPSWSTVFMSLIQFSRHKTIRAYAEKCAKKYIYSSDVLNSAAYLAFYNNNVAAMENLLSQNTDKCFVIRLAKESMKVEKYKFFELLYERFLELESSHAVIKKTRSDLFVLGLEKRVCFVGKYLLSKGLDPNEIEDGDSYLIWACRSHNSSLAEALIKFGADVNQLSSSCDSPLYYAILMHDLNVVKLLLEFGADPCIKNDRGFTPLLLSAYEGHSSIFFELFKVDKDLCQISKSQLTPFLAACKSGNMQIVKALIEAGSCLTSVNIWKCNCLHFAAKNDNFFNLLILLFEKLDKKDFKTMLTSCDSEQYRPVDYLIRKTNKKMVSDLLIAIPELADIIGVPIYKSIKNNSNQDMCLICRDDFVNNDCAIILPCKHVFHEDCYSEWDKEMTICPYCREPTHSIKDRVE